jgi:glycosyltransferase involved in cell wall biosynthesis
VRLDAIAEKLNDSKAQIRSEDSVAGVVLHASFEDGSEAAEETRAIASRLARSDLPVQVVARDAANPTRRRVFEPQRKMFERLVAQRLDLAGSVLYQAGPPTGWNLDFYGRYRVGRTAFGTDRIPDGWAERCNAMDELWLPSEFHRETFAASGVDGRKIRVVSSGVDAGTFRPGRERIEIPHARSFRFLAFTDGYLHSGADVIVRAFVEEFAAGEDVALILCNSTGCDNVQRPALQSELLSFIEIDLDRRLEEIPAVIFLNGALGTDERARLIASSQAFVNALRADPTGRECLEALASEVPIIATDWGSVRGFLTIQNSFLVEASDVVPANVENELIAGHRWAEPNRDQLRRLMREVFTDRREAMRRAEQGRRDVLERFEWSVVFPQWAREFRRLLS